MKYSQDHEWVKLNEDGTALIGITDFAQAQLGDLVYIELPEVGEEITKGKPVSVIESVKAASELYAPVNGIVIAVNEALDDEPERVNEDALGSWFIKVELKDPSELESLMDESAYLACIEKE